MEERQARTGGELRWSEIRVLRGPNLWRLEPLVAGELEMGRWVQQSPASVPGLARGLLESLPGLEGGTRLPAALEGGWPTLLAELSLFLQGEVALPVSWSQVVPSSGSARATVLVEYREEPLGVESLHQALRLLIHCLRGEGVEREEVLAPLRQVYHRARPGTTSMLLIEAARARGIPVLRFPGDCRVQLGLGCHQRHVDASMTSRTNVIATDLASHKERTKEVLRRVGLPVPEGAAVQSREEAREVAKRLGFPLLLKPLDANEGRGISGRLDSLAELEVAWEEAAALSAQVVVERYQTGRDHRVVVVGGRVVAVAERIPAHVVGDGRRSIRELAEAVNREPRRDPQNPRAMRARIPLDGATERRLERAGHSWQSVPKEGERVWLRPTANLSTGGTSVDRTEEIHPLNRRLAELAAGAVGLDVAGLDLLTPDISVPFRENGAVILEVNASPGLRMHTEPDQGQGRDVPGAILDFLYPPGSACRIPVVAVTGGEESSLAVPLLAHLLGQHGRRVGHLTREGACLQGQGLLEGEIARQVGAHALLTHPQVELAVLEVMPEEVLKRGLPFDACEVGVVLSVAGAAGEEERRTEVEEGARAQAVVPAVVRESGASVLSADQPRHLAMRQRARGRTLLFSIQGEGNPHIEAHLQAEGTAVLREEDGWLVIRQGRARIEVAPEREVPLLGGDETHPLLGAVLATIAAAHALNLQAHEIAQGLRSFAPSPAAEPGAAR